MSKASEGQWEPYDPSWLVNLAKEQRPEAEWLPRALADCTKAKQGNSEAYLYFVDSQNANKPGSAWQFETNITLQSPTEGWLILDVLKDNEIGGIEFYDRLNKGPYIECPCGFTLTSFTVNGHKWLTYDDEQYKLLKDIDSKLKLTKNKEKALLHKQKKLQRGFLYECSNCGRIMWRRSGKGNYQVYLPESEA
ncbi:MAG: hypothetical protein AAF485_05500 [Chloroflexota bacterium]